MEALGDTAVDFDFGPPEIDINKINQQTQTTLFSTIDSIDDRGNPNKSSLILLKSGSSTTVRGKKIFFATAHTSNAFNCFTAADVKEYEVMHNRSILIREKQPERPAWSKLRWPIYVLFGNRNVSVFTLFLYER